MRSCAHKLPLPGHLQEPRRGIATITTKITAASRIVRDSWSEAAVAFLAEASNTYPNIRRHHGKSCGRDPAVGV